jgi:hypothetical protein
METEGLRKNEVPRWRVAAYAASAASPRKGILFSIWICYRKINRNAMIGEFLQ